MVKFSSIIFLKTMSQLYHRISGMLFRKKLKGAATVKKAAEIFHKWFGAAYAEDCIIKKSGTAPTNTGKLFGSAIQNPNVRRRTFMRTK